MSGTIYGVGLGPGDPELMSLRAHRLLGATQHIAYFRKAGRAGQARQIVDGLLREDAVEYAMEYPVTTEIPLDDPRYNAILSEFYEHSCAHLRGLAAQNDVVVLCEGDPFFYGSFMHLYNRLRSDCDVQVVPAITGMTAAWHATGQPVTWGDDVMTVLMGTLPQEDLTTHITRSDALVVMKIGRHLGKVRAALQAAGRYEDAWLVQYASMPGQTVQRVSEIDGDSTPYFSIIIVHGQGRRP